GYLTQVVTYTEGREPDIEFPALRKILTDIKDADGLFYLGSVQRSRSNLSEALLCFDDVVRLEPDFPHYQFRALRKAVSHTIEATRPDGNRKVGVVAHTAGSGRSLLMVFYAWQIIKHPAMGNPTLVIITDRNLLVDQLFGMFSMCKDLLGQTPQKAETR